ncbi:hypothetical protein KCP77_01190 [Salmonella enterica subsp. enterica]|nr:hypothetical protein KCP77_01190 [Salmonella enterica subsp. enterica]
MCPSEPSDIFTHYWEKSRSCWSLSTGKPTDLAGSLVSQSIDAVWVDRTDDGYDAYNRVGPESLATRVLNWKISSIRALRKIEDGIAFTPSSVMRYIWRAGNFYGGIHSFAMAVRLRCVNANRPPSVCRMRASQPRWSTVMATNYCSICSKPKFTVSG